MLQEKKKDLDGEKQKKLLLKLLEKLSAENGDLYYQSSSVVAGQIREYAQEGSNLNADERALLAPLTQRDIEVLLALH